MNEEWKPIEIMDGVFAEYYEVSNLGNVRSYVNNRWGKRKQPKLLKPSNPKKDFYRMVNLRIAKDVHKTFTVHYLVASAFIPNPSGYTYINHKDGNKKNNCVDNLEWCTAKDNMQHASRMNLMKRRQIREVATGKEYPSIYEAARQIGCTPNQIYNHLDGYRLRKGDIKYEYVI